MDEIKELKNIIFDLIEIIEGADTGEHHDHCHRTIDLDDFYKLQEIKNKLYPKK